MRRIVGLAILVLLISGVLIAQDRQALRWQGALSLVEVAVAELRMLDSTNHTSVHFVSRDEAAAHIDRLFYEEYPPERINMLYQMYRALDLAQPGLDLGALYLEFLKSAIGGYYDPEGETMYIILPDGPLDAVLPLQQQLTYVHEFIHALQDQHFDLDAFVEANSSEDDPDGRLALSALVEGDATHATMQFLFLLPEDDKRILGESPSDAELPPAPPDDLPRIVLSEIDFIYWEGRRFVEQLVNAGGWEVVNHAFLVNPPQTSEQIMHPERYLQGQGALRIEIQAAADLIDEGWQISFEGRVGEFYLLHHLETHINAPDSVRFANGWGGDSLRIYTDEKGDEMMWIWHQVWDRANDAEQFAEGYAYFLDKRYFGRYQRERADEPCWVGADETHCLQRISETETRISMAADRETALASLDA